MLSLTLMELSDPDVHVGWYLGDDAYFEYNLCKCAPSETRLGFSPPFLLITLNLKLYSAFHCSAFSLCPILSLLLLLKDQSGLRIKFAALTLCDKMSSKTSRAWIIMPVVLRSLAPHRLSGGAHRFGIWETADVNLAAAPEGNGFSDIMGHWRLLWHRISGSYRQTDGQRDVDPLPPHVLTFLLWYRAAIYLSK